MASAFDKLKSKRCTAVITVPAPLAPPAAFLRNQRRNMSFFWDSPGDLPHAGAGAVEILRVSGPKRCAQLEARLERLWNDLVVHIHPDCAPPPPRAFGGMSFHPDGASSRSPHWQEFDDGCFTLPRWCYGHDGKRAFLSLAVRGPEDCDPVRGRELVDELEAILLGLERAAEASPVRHHERPAEAPANAAGTIHQIDVRTWERRIAEIHRAIGTGEFQKIVAARRCDVELPWAVDELEVLSRLVAEPMCTRFLFGREKFRFLGASPELLFHKRGKVLRTEALAGTSPCPAGADVAERANALLASRKDRVEHAFVVREIAQILGPLCKEFRSPAQPRVRSIREILHLYTPFEGSLEHEMNPIRLLAALHPTPAVGGLPKAHAAEWIARHEVEPRGWYTGPVGWVDAAGDARFVVAIRCGLVGECSALIFTGAGIVEESLASAEYAETTLKQLPLLRALGFLEEAFHPKPRQATDGS
ncbi:isochorismate synthase MenF [Pendulispora albinea]|uniref:isochorismate synthase n=1 Tax=Pendulispora albinea TaxID=2741071 RepID=A0ABZ2LMP0_9BACT